MNPWLKVLRNLFLNTASKGKVAVIKACEFSENFFLSSKFESIVDALLRFKSEDPRKYKSRNKRTRVRSKVSKAVWLFRMEIIVAITTYGYKWATPLAGKLILLLAAALVFSLLDFGEFGSEAE